MSKTKVLQADTAASTNAPAHQQTSVLTYRNPDETTSLPVYREHDTGPHMTLIELEEILRSKDIGKYNDANLWQTFIDCNPGWTENDSKGTMIERAFFSAITEGNEELIALMIKSHLVSANMVVTESWSQETPLLRAVAVKNVNVVKLLLEFGADKDAFGTVNICYARDLHTYNDYSHITRTPLQLAASMGHLVMVKLLVEEYKCDDSLVAPDGQIAIRLAAEYGHSEVVDYLPPLRRGGFLRWKHKNRASIKRIKKAAAKIGRFLKFFLWDLEKFFIWSIPKHAIVIPMRNGCSWCFKNRKYFGPWCKRQFLSIPTKVNNSAIWVKDNAIKAGKDFLEFLTKRLPRLAKKFVLWLWKLLIVKIPAVVRLLIKWTKDSALSIVSFVSRVISNIFSLLSTVFEAIISFFRRITLRDIWNAFCKVLSSIFIAFPKLLVEWVVRFGNESFELLHLLFGVVGEVIWYIVAGITWLAAYLPRQVWKILQGVWASLSRGVYEVRVWINPKAI